MSILCPRAFGLTIKTDKITESDTARRILETHGRPPHLGEPNVVRVYAETLAAHVESILADQTVLVRAHAAAASALAVLLGVRVDQSLGTHGNWSGSTYG